jgi:hypothetical protein
METIDVKPEMSLGARKAVLFRPAALLFLVACLVLEPLQPAWTIAAEAETPRLRKRGTATQLIVDGSPYLMLAGELHNSSASGVEYMRSIWPHLKALGLNTVIAPASWELIEPREGQFDFTYVDEMIDLARKHEQRIVLLWFGSWKNGVSSYCPGWVLRDTARFPRAKGSSNQNTKDVLSTLSDANLRADAGAFARLMRHVEQVDGHQHTVILVQVQNEVGIKPETRDMSDTATAAYRGPVPAELIEHLRAHKDDLHPVLKQRWSQSDFASSGTWEAVFGGGREAEEVFSAWHYARYIDQVAAAGQAEYNLPMYVNSWLASELGSYPTGGPVAHMHDVWRAAAPHIALFAPDIYIGEFKEVCAAYARSDNPLFVPEARTDAEAASRACWVIGQHRGLGFAPFGVESMPADHPMVDIYRMLGQLAPKIVAAQAKDRILGVYRQGGEDHPKPATVGDYVVRIRYEDRLPKEHPPVGGIVLQESDDTFLVAGYGFGCQFQATTPGPRSTDIDRVELGHFDEDGQWVHKLWLNGDETGANNTARIPPFGRNLRLGVDRPMILRVTLYRHE